MAATIYLTHAARQAGRPFLGICLGLQLLFEGSEENGGVEGLGLVPGRVTLFDAAAGLPVPHIGWNDLLQKCAAAARSCQIVACGGASACLMLRPACLCHTSAGMTCCRAASQLPAPVRLSHGQAVGVLLPGEVVGSGQ